jgi:hypothetical protein
MLPLAAIAVALISLRRIGASEGQLTGRLPAVAGLCLATFFLSWSLSQRFGREIILEGHARQFAEAWLNLVASGDLQQAHQMRASAHSRVMTPAARQEYYDKNPESLKDLKDFFAASPVKEFVAAGQNVDFHFESAAGYERAGSVDIIILKYVFQDRRGTSTPIWISVKRELDADEDRSDWQIEKVVGEDALLQ